MMAKNYLQLVVVLALACFGPGVAAAQVSSGTTFAVAPGFLITNQHVIAECASVDVFAAEGRHTASILDADDQIDLALLKVSGIKGATARLRTPRHVRLGESVMVFGFPLSGALSSTGNFTSGLISALRGLRDAAGELQITAPVQRGNSGAPLMDASGLVIGVVQSKLDALRSAIASGDIPQNVNFAISLDVLADFLVKNKIAFLDGPISAPLDTARVAELAQGFTYRVECRARAHQAVISPSNKPSRPEPAPDANREPELESTPACIVGLGLEFRYADGHRTTRRIIAREHGLCVVKSESEDQLHYDKDWILVKQISKSGTVFSKPSPEAPLVGERLLRFPLLVGQTWEIEYPGLSQNRRDSYVYKNAFSVLSRDEVIVPAGTFNAFKIRHEQINMMSRRWGVRYLWYVPELGYYVKRQYAVDESRDASYWTATQDFELISVARPKTLD